MKLCECGCGNPAPIAKYTSKRYGWVKGQPKRFIHNHHFRGSRNVNYNNGLCFSEGRWWIRCRNNTYVQYARAVVETELKRPLLDSEVVHHKDEDPINDAPENLQLCKNQSEHRALHSKYTDDELIQALVVKAQKLGREPMATDIDNDPSIPSRETYRYRLGGLLRAKEIAGIRKVVKVV